MGMGRNKISLIGAGQIGGTILDFKTYKSSSPFVILDLGIPFDSADCWADLADFLSNNPFGILAFLEFSKVSFIVNPKSVKIITANIKPNKHNILDFDFIIYNVLRKKFPSLFTCYNNRKNIKCNII